MEAIKNFIKKPWKRQYAFLCLMLITNLAIHFAIINNPPLLVFDEQHYINNAKIILDQHSDNRTEHPPLGKLIIASDVAVFGDNPFGWRTFAILFGTANILLFFLICRRLGMSLRAGNLAAFLLTFENLSFVQGGMAMLDVFSLTFMLLSFWLYLKENYPLSAVAVALATLTKLTGVFAVPVIFLHWLIFRRKKTVYFLASALLAPLSFLLLFPALEFVIYRRFVDYIGYIKIMLTQSASLTFATTTHPQLIRPWEIIMLPKVMPYYYTPHIFAAISFTVWAVMIPAFIYMIIRAVKKNEAALFGALWFSGAFLIWIPLSLITDRVSYLYYFYPAVGAVIIGISMGLSQLIDFWKNRPAGKLRWVAIGAVVVFLVLHLAIFIIIAPVNPWPVWQWFK